MLITGSILSLTHQLLTFTTSPPPYTILFWVRPLNADACCGRLQKLTRVRSSVRRG